MFEEVTKNYAGGQAVLEIVIMLLVAFILGFLFRWLWDKIYGLQEEYEEFIIEDQNPMTVEETKSVRKKPSKKDDLKIIEGIGPKIEALLQDAKIDTWQELAKTDAKKIKSILEQAGDRFSFHNPTTWPEQAKLAAQERWDELEAFQKFLNGGK